MDATIGDTMQILTKSVIQSANLRDKKTRRQTGEELEERAESATVDYLQGDLKAVKGRAIYYNRAYFFRHRRYVKSFAGWGSKRP